MFCKMLVVTTVLLALVAAAPPDPILGTWKLNLSKSKFNPGPAPRSQTRTYIQTPEGVQVTIETIGANGRAAKPIEILGQVRRQGSHLFADERERVSVRTPWP